MSASADIFSFPRRTASSNNWSNQDLAEVYRCIDQLARHGIAVEAASGLSEEGDPWFALEEINSGEALIHIARIDGFYVVHIPDIGSYQGQTLRAVLSQLDLAGITHFDQESAAPQPGTGDDGDDVGGINAFLRVVCAVAGVIAPALISVLGAPDALALDVVGDTDLVHGSVADLTLLDMSVTIDIGNKEKATVTVTAEDDANAITPQTTPLKALAAIALITEPEPTKPEQVPVLMPAIAVVATPEVVVPVAAQPVALAIPMIADDEVVHFLSGDTITAKATKEDDVFVIILAENQNKLTISIEDFSVGQDQVVIEKTTAEGSTSSAIILDLSSLMSATSTSLTLIGQAGGDTSHAGG